jgi:hypothetical protein
MQMARSVFAGTPTEMLPAAGARSTADGPMVPLAAVLNMIGQSERQNMMTMMFAQNLQSSQAMSDSQRIAALYLAGRF